MKRTFILIMGLGLLLGSPAESKPRKKKKRKAKKVLVDPAVAKEAAAKEEFARIFRFYKKKYMKPAALWENVVELKNNKYLPQSYRVTLVQMQSDLLVDAGLPVAGATYAVNALKMAKNPRSSTFDSSWHILNKVSVMRPIQYLLENLALSLKLEGANPHAFGNNWNYIVGNALTEKGYEEKAVSFYRRVNQSSRYFMPSRYQLAMIDYDKGRYKAASAHLKAILLPSTHRNSPLSVKDRREMLDYANMALGRLHYERKQFLSSARYFRRVHKRSPIYYEALFEQAWSLFMSGNPKHALGSLYGANSPYFAEMYNPEAKVLESTVYFWMCRYEDSRNALADFAQKYSESVEKLSDYVDRNSFNPASAYRLFENLVSGVSSESLGIPREVLNAAATRDTLLLVRDQLATVLTERDRLSRFGVHGSKAEVAQPLARLTKIRNALQQQLGSQFIEELKAERDHYENLYSQSQFLYLELLMSEKEQLLGRELHASSKVADVSDYNDIRGWGRNTQSWKSERKGEYWWDEIGFHIVNVEPKCVEQ